MILKELYINNVLVDFPQNQSVAITVQGYSPLTQDVAKVSFSNTLTLPLTKTNRNAIGLLDDIKSASQLYKTKIPARYVQNGIEVLPDAYIIIQSIGDTIKLNLYESGIDFYSQVANKFLCDLSYTDVNRSWAAVADQDQLRNSQEPISGVGVNPFGKIFSLFIDRGLNLKDYLGVMWPNRQHWLLPAFGYKQILENILTQSNHTFNWDPLQTGGGGDDIKFASLAVLPGNYNETGLFWNYSKKWIKDVEFNVQLSANFVTAVTAVIPFDIIRKPSPFFNTSTFKFEYTNADAVGGFAGYSVFAAQYYASLVVQTGLGSAARVDLVNDVGTILVSVNCPATSTTNVSIDTVAYSAGIFTANGVPHKNGAKYYLQIVQLGGLNITVKKGAIFLNKFGGGGDGGNVVTNENPQNFGYIYFNQLLPQDITQLQFMKDFFFRFGMIPKIKNRKLTIKSIKDILASSSFNDWTNKRVTTVNDVITPLSGLAQTNSFQYQNNDRADIGYFYQLSPYSGSGSFTIDDLNLPTEKITESIFTATEDLPSGSGFTSNARVECQILNDFTKYAADTGFRLLMIRAQEATEPALKYDASLAARTTYGVGIAYKNHATAYERSLSYKNIFDQWYTEFFSRLKNARWVTRYYNFNDTDIAMYDPHKMIFDDNTQFMFPTFFNYIPGKPTKVTMLKL